jgi:CRISPR/Cas system-associated exonuclease Cas4 (RecB family)
MKNSYSRMKMYRNCPRQFKFRINHTPESSLPTIMVKGKYAHRFYEEYVNGLLRTNSTQDLNAARDLYNVVYALQSAESRDAGEPILSIDEWRDTYNALCLPWAERTAIQRGMVTGVEERICINATGQTVPWDDDDVWFRAVLDRVESDDAAHVVVTDYKTGFARTSDEMQARVYAWLLLWLTGCDSVTVIFEHTATDWRETYSYEKAMFTAMRDEILAICQIIEDDAHFDPTPGVACAECAYRYCCDAKVAVVDVINCHEDACKAIEAIALLDSELSAMKGALKRWCDGVGTVTHNGLVWGYHQSDGLGFHDPALFLKEVPDAVEFMSVNNTKAKKLFKKYPHLLTKEPKQTFRAVKAKGDVDE